MRTLDRLILALPALLLVIGCRDSGSANPASGTDTETETGTGPTSTTDGGSTAGSASGGPTTSGTTDSDTGTTGPSCPSIPEGEYGVCTTEMWFCPHEGFCLQDEMNTFGVCSRGCVDTCNCWGKPATGDAVPACNTELSNGPNGICVLDCSGGRSCATGMICDPTLSICAFPDDGGGSGSGSGTSTSTGGGSGTGTSTGG